MLKKYQTNYQKYTNASDAKYLSTKVLKYWHKYLAL